MQPLQKEKKMKDALLKELQNEMVRLEGIRVVQSEEIKILEGGVKDLKRNMELKRIMELEYLSGKIDELERVIDLIKQID